MEDAVKKDEPQQSFAIEGVLFCVNMKASHRGAGVYANESRDKYLRIGPSETIERELAFHKQLITLGWPVAPILSEGTEGSLVYFIEKSLGDELLGRVFRQEAEATGAPSVESFTKLLEIAKAVHDAQETEATGKVDTEHFSRAVHFEKLKDELPEQAQLLEESWQKMLAELQAVPSCLTHGDFNPHNMLMGGLIDFGDSFRGPIGFDLVTAITAPFWFIPDKSAKFARGYDFTDEQIDEYFAKVGVCNTKDGAITLREKFDALFLSRGVWWTVGNQFNEQLRLYRYDKYLNLLNRYLKGESMYDYWRANRAK